MRQAWSDSAHKELSEYVQPALTIFAHEMDPVVGLRV